MGNRNTAHGLFLVDLTAIVERLKYRQVTKPAWSSVIVELDYAIPFVNATYELCRKKICEIVFGSSATEPPGTPECRTEICHVITCLSTASAIDVNDAIVAGAGVEIVKQDHEHLQSAQLARLVKGILAPIPT